PRAPRDGVRAVVLLVPGLGDDRDLDLTLRLLDVDLAADLGELRGALRVPGLEDLDDARQAVRDVRAGDAAGVERPHRQLRARLADRMRGDDGDRVAHHGGLAGGQRAPVALLAHADGRLALEHGAHRQRLGRVAVAGDQLGQLGAADLLA